MNDNTWPFSDPQVAGVKEHHSRIQSFLEIANNTEDSATVFRLYIACIYFAQGIIELIYEAADNKQIPSSREQMKEQLSEKLRWFKLIEKIRLHDFHRYGITPPNQNMNVCFLGGPIKLKAQKGHAIYKIPSSGPKIETSGHSTVHEQQPLLYKNGLFF